jgi:hypothetical protein
MTTFCDVLRIFAFNLREVIGYTSEDYKILCKSNPRKSNFAENSKEYRGNRTEKIKN